MDRSAYRQRQVFNEPVCLVFRRAPTISGCRTPYNPAGPPLSRTTEGHIRLQGALVGHESLPASAHSDRCLLGPSRMRRLLRFVARAPPRCRHRLGRRSRAISPCDRTTPVANGSARPGERGRYLDGHDTPGFSGALSIVQRRGVQFRTNLDAERMVSAQQSERRCQRTLSGRSRNTARRWDTGSSLLRQNARRLGTRCPPPRPSLDFRAPPTAPPAGK